MDQPLMSRSFGASELEPLFDLRQILSFAWRQWKFATMITALVLLVGFNKMLSETPLFTATAQILLEKPREKAFGIDEILAAADPDAAMVEGEMAILRSSVFLQRVVEREHVTALPATARPASTGRSLIDTLRGFIPGVSAAKTEPSAAPKAPSKIKAMQALRQSLSVKRVSQNGFVLAISVTSPDPARAALLANAVADGYLVDKLDTRYEAAKRGSAWLNDRLVELRKQLHDSEEAVSQFRIAHNLLQSGNVTLNQQQLSELNAKLVDARADAAQKKARVDLLDTLQSRGGGLANLPESPGGTLSSLRQQANVLSQQEADLLAKYGQAHPLVVNIRAQERDVDRSIAAETQRAAEAVRNDYALAKSRVASLEKSLQEATGQTSIDDATAIRLRELERTAAVNKTLFEDFLQRAKVTEEQSTFEPHDARIITPAVPPGAPSYPRKISFMSVALVIGLFLGIAAAVAKEMLNKGFTTVKQVEDVLGLPVLTSMSSLSRRDLQINGTAVQIADYPGVRPLSRFSEALRALRSGIQMTDVDHPPKVIQITSTVPFEGKTTLALALARSTVAANSRVLVIDADLRRPSASRLLEAEGPGLVELLLGEAEAEQVIRFNEKTQYWILATGTRTPAPIDLLGSERMKALMTDLRKEFDMIIVDTPPIGPVIDPVVVSNLVDKVVVVVRWGSTARELVKECVQQISGLRKVAGIVLNRVDERKAQKYGKYSYAYYYRRHHYGPYYVK